MVGARARPINCSSAAARCPVPGRQSFPRRRPDTPILTPMPPPKQALVHRARQLCDHQGARRHGGAHARSANEGTRTHTCICQAFGACITCMVGVPTIRSRTHTHARAHARTHNAQPRVHAHLQVSATFSSDKPSGYLVTREYSWTQSITVTSPDGARLGASLLACWVGAWPTSTSPLMQQTMAPPSSGLRRRDADLPPAQHPPGLGHPADPR